jgi:hypothetical protein
MRTYESRMITRIFAAIHTAAKPLMKNHLFPLFILLILPCVPLKAQSLGGTLKADPGTELLLIGFTVNDLDTVAKGSVGMGGSFKLTPAGPNYHGMYRLVWKGEGVDLVWDGSNIRFTHYGGDSVDVQEGKAWKEYRKLTRMLTELRRKEKLLKQLQVDFADDKALTTEAERGMQRVVARTDSLKRAVDQAQAGDIALGMIRFEWPFIGRNKEDLTAELKPGRYLSLLTLDDSNALHHPHLTRHIVEYFGMYEPTEEASEDLQALLFMNSVLEKLERAHPSYFYPVSDFLRMGMESMNRAGALQLLAMKVSAREACDNPALEQRLKGQLNRYLAVLPGMKAPDLDSLYTTDGRYTLLKPAGGLYIFWRAGCDHCMEQLPVIMERWKSKSPQLKVTTVSLDTAPEGWLKAIGGWQGWTHLRDPAGQLGTNAANYLLVATPMYMWVDPQGTIIDIFRSETQLFAKMGW